jgi:N-acetylglutamate synthase-like GNAT family acetyltransferase
MVIRKARPADIEAVLSLAGSLGLDDPGLKDDAVWIAEENDRLLGHVALRKHPDCDELIALGVAPAARGRGLGRSLVETLLRDAPGDVFLATVIPDFFARLGFEKAARVPPGMVKEPDWCEGCSKDRCTVMVRHPSRTLPVFPEFKELGLEDKDAVESFLKDYPVEACELGFGNSFIWRHFDHPRITLVNGNLCLRYEPPDEPPYFLQPVGTNDIPGTIATCLTAAPRLSRIPVSFAAEYCPGFSCEPDRDNFDYVYASTDLIELRGKKYDGKRNRIRKFERTNASRYLRLTPEALPECRLLFDEWLAEKTANGPMAGAQNDAIQEALTHFAVLGLAGGAIEVDGRIAAFSIGERLSSDTAVIHIEIVSPRYDGLAQLMNREFVRHEFSSFANINREQDMGVPGLRRAKLSYQPHHFVEKHHIWK